MAACCGSASPFAAVRVPVKHLCCGPPWGTISVSTSPLDQILADNPTLAEHVESNTQFREYLEEALQANPQLFAADRSLAKEWQDRLSQHRNWLVRTEYEVSTSYDKTLVTLATGALALSVALLNVLNLDSSDSALIWLRLGWVALVASIVTLLGSVAVGRISLRHAISFTDQMLVNPPSLIQNTPEQDRPKPKRWSNWLTIVLTAVASLLFAAGVASLVYFAASTVPPKVGITLSSTKKPSKSRPAGGEEKHGYSPPPPPPAPVQQPSGNQPQKPPAQPPGKK